MTTALDRGRASGDHRAVPWTLRLPIEDADALEAAERAAGELGARATELVEVADGALVLAALVDEAPSPSRLAPHRATIEAATLLDDASTWRADPRAPVRVGPLWIAPPDARVPAGAPCVRVDASAAFGSGLHPTTRLCVERLAARPPARALLDVGTGTGILALAALALGAGSAVAVDIDPAARTAARRNAEASGLPLEVLDGPPPAHMRFDVVVANILGPELIALAPELVRSLDRDGTLLLSGIRPDLEAEVGAAYRHLGLAHVLTEAHDGWVALELVARW